MRRVLIFAIFLLTGVLANARTFIHPGSILTTSDLNRIKQHIDNHDEPWYSSWKLLQADPFGNLSRTANPSTEIGGSDGTRQRSAGDAYAALLDAIQWHVTGDTKYATHAVSLLSAWGNKVQTANAELFQFPSRTMCIAAEMLRYEDGSFYEGWNANDLNTFKNMVRTVLYPACKSQALNNTMPSWSAPASTAVMAAGILLDDSVIYQEGVAFYRSTSIAGSVYNTIVNEGQIKEMGRDNVHAMLALNDLAQMAQMAWSQGDDLYGEGDNRLLKGFEYFCTYNLGHEDLAYTPVTSADGSSTWYYISTHNNGFRLAPDGHCYEAVYHHYKEIKHLDMETLYPRLTAFAKLARPETEQENLGFGTLLFTIDAATSPLMTEVPRAAENLQANSGVGSVWLSWKDNNLDDASGFKILRSTDGKTFSTLIDWNNYTRKQYRDETAVPGQTYYYKALPYNYAGVALSSDIACVNTPDTAALPIDWHTIGIGNGWTEGHYTNSMNNSFTLSGGGNGFRRSDEGHGFIYHKLVGDGSLTVRLVSTIEGFDAVGIILRGTLSSGSAQMGITLGGTGYRYCQAISRTTSGGQTNWKTGDDFTYAPVWMKLERKGSIIYTYQSRDGINWFLIQSLAISLPNTAYIGMLLSSSATYQASFDHVSLVETNVSESSSIPTNLVTTCGAGNNALLKWRGVYNADGYVIYRSTEENGIYDLVDTTLTNSFKDTQLAVRTYYYRVAAIVKGTEGTVSQTAAVDIMTDQLITGTPVGTAGSWNNNSQTTFKAALDGNLSTFFDANISDGAWSGYDLGNNYSAQILEVRFCPRSGYPARMVGGKFQGANTSDFSDSVTLYTVTDSPIELQYTVIPVTDTGRYRYLRYISPSNGYGNVADIQFYGFKFNNDQINGISSVTGSSDSSAKRIYTIDGVEHRQLQKGINIVIDAHKVRKIYVR